jgi:hypothetical protein
LRQREKKKKKTDKKSDFSSRTCAVGSNDGLEVHEGSNHLFATVRLEIDKSQAINAPRRHIIIIIIIVFSAFSVGALFGVFRPRRFAFRRTRLLGGARRGVVARLWRVGGLCAVNGVVYGVVFFLATTHGLCEVLNFQSVHFLAS